MKKNQLIILVLGIFFFATNCKKDSNSGNPASVLVLNEGSFNNSNSSISSYDPETKEVGQRVFRGANNDAVLGDVLQSGKIIDKELYLVLNNSHKITVVDPKTLVLKRSLILPEGASPRYVSKGKNDELLVSDLFGTAIWRINKTNGELIGKIEIGVNSETMVQVGSKLYIANPGPWPSYSNTISVLNLTDYSFKKIEVSGVNVQELRVDNQNNVWATATGNYSDITGKLIVIDGVNAEIIKTIELGGTPTDFAIIQARNEIVVLNSDKIQLINKSDYSIKNEQFIKGNFYTLAVDEVGQKIYVTDAKDFVSDGILKVYSTQGDSLDQVTVGVAPGYIQLVD